MCATSHKMGCLDAYEKWEAANEQRADDLYAINEAIASQGIRSLCVSLRRRAIRQIVLLIMSYVPRYAAARGGVVVFF